MNKRYKFLLLCLTMITCIFVGCSENKETNTEVKKNAQKIATAVSEGDMDKLNELIFDISELETKSDSKDDDVPSKEGILQKIFERETLKVKEMESDAIIFEAEVPNLENIFTDIDMNKDMTEEELYNKVTEYIEKAEINSMKFSAPVIEKDGKVQVDYKNEIFLNGITGGFFKAYEGLYQEMLEKYSEGMRE